jgi:DNA-binding response OmpR family regulator
MEILHLEDYDSDAELISAAILQEWPDFRIRRVFRREDFERALATGKFDLILSDNELPGFSGIAPVEIARAKRADLPFIFLSRTIGEARAIGALRQGAADYVIKGAAARLVPAIRAAILNRQQALEKRQAEEEVFRSHEGFQQIAKASITSSSSWDLRVSLFTETARFIVSQETDVAVEMNASSILCTRMICTKMLTAVAIYS